MGERWQDGADCMARLVNLAEEKGAEKEITKDERDMLSACYKQVIGKLRESLRTLKPYVEKEGTPHKDDVRIYIAHVEKELTDKALGLINLVRNKIFKCPISELAKSIDKDNAETNIFYLKLCGDYYRYIAELADPNKPAPAETKENPSMKTLAKEMYSAANDAAASHLNETSPIRLGLALNWSVCLYELLDEKKKAAEVAKKAFDDAIAKLDTLNDASYKDSTMIMQLLRDNLTIWTAEGDNQANQNDVAD